MYKDFLKDEKEIKEIIEENQNALEFFQQTFNLDNKSIDFLPAFFNFIECYLELGNIPEVKKYLIVGLSNIMFSNKKNDATKENEVIDFDEEDEQATTKKALRSRLDLLFARFNLAIKKYNEASEKINNSIILYSEIYGPESVGLTPNYYYLASYFGERPNVDGYNDKRELIIKNIYLKIADIWRKYFVGEKFELFESKKI